ncbi:ATPase AAA [Halostagnicola larsenii XH-48]|uniref:ATPase AAA n=1 Tax=Halostagnicola larsenii XH-48 TaxID=797299 RepID=W0JMV7_9EURY|nr:PQQ-binding-like beta-propeller repeat protein [Halostagnicola larsenii]AHG00051.1 ATPase AAA [Halostagnicola larsenii XH-48]
MWKRRSVLTTGAALTIGTGLASVGAGASEADIDELPDPDRDPGPNEDWPSHRGDPGHARYIADGHEFDGGELEAAWSVAGAGAGSVAVADETVYTPTDDGVVALDATDGTVVWENTDIDAGTPSVAGETVYLSGNEVVALARSNGSVRWETEFDPEEEIVWQTVAYGGVYAVADGTLYALEADDGSVRWKRESVSSDDDEHEFIAAPAAANGVVYSATTAGPIALEPETGAEVWRDRGPTHDAVYATSTAVALNGNPPYWQLYDAQTGELVSSISGSHEIAFGEEIMVGGDLGDGYSGGSIHSDEYWWTSKYHPGQGVISGETVFAYLAYTDPVNGEASNDLVALTKYDGSEKWTLSKDDAPVGPIRAISGETIYVDNDGELVALREETDTDDQSDESDDTDDQPDENDDTDDQPDENDDTDDQPDENDDTDGGNDEGDDQQDSEDDSDAGEDGSDDEDECPCPDDDPADDDGESVDDGDSGNVTAGDGDAENETKTKNNSDADNVPGFTAGGGLLGGALGLEWLRRKAGVDESTSVNEPSE